MKRKICISYSIAVCRIAYEYESTPRLSSGVICTNTEATGGTRIAPLPSWCYGCVSWKRSGVASFHATWYTLQYYFVSRATFVVHLHIYNVVLIYSVHNCLLQKPSFSIDSHNVRLNHFTGNHERINRSKTLVNSSRLDKLGDKHCFKYETSIIHGRKLKKGNFMERFSYSVQSVP